MFRDGVSPDPQTPLARTFTTSVAERFAAQAAATPDAIALSDATSEHTYSQVKAESARWARALQERGVRRGDVVIVVATRSAGLPSALFGVLEAGAAFAILDPAYPMARVQQAARALAAKAWIDLTGTIVFLLDELGAAVRPSAHAAQSLVSVSADDVAYVAFTSGTSGLPKGIIGEHAPLPHFLDWHVAHGAFTAADRFTMLSGLAHDPLLRDIFTPLTIGARVCIPPEESVREPRALRAFLAAQCVTVAHLTPALGQVLGYGETKMTLPHLRALFFAGETLTQSVAAKVRALAPNARLTNFYGATETPQAMGFYDLQGDEAVIPIGCGIADVQLLVMSARSAGAPLELSAPGEIGEIVVRTPYLTRGYLDDPELTAARFVTNPFTNDPRDRLYRTGDRGRLRRDGCIELVGRADRQVKIRGFRVELEDIEAAIARHSAVEQAVIVQDDGALVAYVQGAASVESVRDHLRRLVPDYMVPGEIIVVANLPFTQNGKVDRAALRDRVRATAPVGRGVRNEDEAALLSTWEQVFARGPLSAEADFFALGGHSLLALELLAAIERRFGVRLPMSVFLRSPSVASMTPLLSGTIVGGHLVSLQPSGDALPVYWLPGGGGLSVMAFRQVSQRLGAHPVYGLEAQLDLARTPLALEAMAADYITALRAQRPHGPYHLFGFSLGAFVAFEMAVQLEREGEKLGLVVLFDTAPQRRLTRGLRALVTAQRIAYHLRKARELSPREFVGYANRTSHNFARGLRERMLIRRLRAQSEGGSATPDLAQTVVARHLEAIDAYANKKLPHYGGRVTAVLARDTSLSGVSERFDPRLAWRDSCAGVDIVRVPGTHLSMLEPPDVEVLAETLRARLEAFRES